MKKRIVAINFDACIPPDSPIISHIERLPNIGTMRDLIANYDKSKELCRKYGVGRKIDIMVEEECSCCKSIVCKKYSLKKLKTELSSPQTKIEALIEVRNKFRKKDNFAKADKIRKELSDLGIILEDTKKGTGWRRKI